MSDQAHREVLDLEAIRKRWCGRGPWTYFGPTEVEWKNRPHFSLVEESTSCPSEVNMVFEGDIANQEDIDLLLSVRTDIPALIAALTATRAMLADTLAEVRRSHSAVEAVMKTWQQPSVRLLHMLWMDPDQTDLTQAPLYTSDEAREDIRQFIAALTALEGERP